MKLISIASKLYFKQVNNYLVSNFACFKNTRWTTLFLITEIQENIKFSVPYKVLIWKCIMKIYFHYGDLALRKSNFKNLDLVLFPSSNETLSIKRSV